MDSLSIMLNRLRPNQEGFLDKFITISSVYNSVFDSDTVLMFLAEGTLKDPEGNGRDLTEGNDWIVDIPNIMYGKEGIIKPNFVIFNTEKEPTQTPIPETIEEFRSFAKSLGINIKMNTHTAKKLFG